MAPVNKKGLIINGQEIPARESIKADGMFFRTVAYTTDPSATPDTAHYVTATRQDVFDTDAAAAPELSAQWTLNHVLVEYDPASNEQIHTTTVAKTGLSYYQALYYCASTEAAKESEGWYKTGKAAIDMGLDHYIAFATAQNEGKKNGVIFDADGIPRAASQGRPIENARYSESALEKAAATAARPARSMQKSWMQSTLEEILPNVASPASLHAFIGNAQKLALVEKILESAQKLEGALLSFSHYFEQDVPQQSADDFIATTPVKAGISSAFTKAAKNAPSLSLQRYEKARLKAHHDRYYDRYDDDYDRKHNPKYSAYDYLDEDDLKSLLRDARKSGQYGLADNHALDRLIRMFESDTRSIKTSVEEELKTMDTGITALRSHEVQVEEFDRFKKLADFTFKFFKAKAAANFIRSRTGQQRLVGLPALATCVYDAKESMKALSPEPTNRLDILESMILSPEKPSIPVFFRMFLEQFDDMKTNIGGLVLTPDAGKNTQLSLPLIGGDDAQFGVLREDEDFITKIKRIMDEAGKAKIIRLDNDGYLKGAEDARRRRL